ncbi:MAG: sigma 54-interacting transcriptional regulator [Myxococcales bacterium]|nr:sigma 54-interacting transcriptional regulator [Myxococcales bacterium]
MGRFATLPTPLSAGDFSGAEGAEGAFTRLDRKLETAHGCLIVRAPSTSVARAVAAHAARRLSAMGFSVSQAPANASRAAGLPVFRDMANRLGLTAETVAADCAERLASSFRASRGAVVADLPAPDSWDRQVACELAKSGLPLVLVTEDPAGDDIPGELLEIGGRLDAGDRRRFAATLAEDVFLRAPDGDLVAVDQWWRRAAAAVDAPLAPLSPEATSVLVRLVAAGRSWPTRQLSALALGAERALTELLSQGAVREEAAHLVPVAEAPTATPAERSLVADALETTFVNDVWAMAHAACLRVSSDPARAQQGFDLALQRVAVDARRELIRAWVEAVHDLPTDQRAPLLSSAAHASLDAGDSQDALRLARLAASAEPANAAFALLVGRAAMATGDLATAKAALVQAAQKGETPQVMVELAEVAYLTGDHANAKQLATVSVATSDARVRLAARSVLGKLLLASGSLDSAEAHFAEDAFTANVAGLGSAGRRARLNRAIALMLRGQLVEARSLLEDVRQEGRSAGDVQAQAYALENLSSLASRERDYGAALRFADMAFELRRWQGDRLRMVRLLVTLGMMRRVLGLFEHATHAVRFGRRVLGPGMTVDAAPDFGLIAARIALDCGHIDEAREEARRALSEGETARERGRVLGEAHRLFARIAIEEGDVGRAKSALAQAEAFSRSDVRDDSRWELTYIAALIARAEGTLTKADIEAVMAALPPEYEWDNEYERMTYVLASEVERANGEFQAARAYLDHAIMLRDRVVRSLDPETRESFLRRPDVVALEKLASDIAREGDAFGEEAPATTRVGSVIPLKATRREIVGEDPAIRGLRSAIRRVASSGATVLVRGESGTGKELVAEALHRASDRAAGPLVTVNCAALVETLLLSELFGHEKGAFTGAASRRRGRFELAEGGTLFLDEIGDISPRTQVALLRVLQEKTFERVGGTSPIKANVRIVCATHRDLKQMVERGEFREDLYYRLRGITLEVPALRARLGDLHAIAKTLLDRIAEERGETPKTLSPAALELLQRHRWPGNVRELENALRAASLFADGALIDVREFVENVDDLRAVGTTALGSVPPPPVSVPPPRATVPSLDSIEPASVPSLLGEDEDADGALPPGEAGATSAAYSCIRQGVPLGDLKRQIERDCVARALAETKGNITRAASLLGMKRPRLSQLVKQYGLAAVSESSS